MTGVATLSVPRRRPRLAPRSARLRLTLLYSGMFLILGTAIVVVIALLSSGAARSPSVRPPSAFPGPAGGAVHAAVSQQHSADINGVLAGAWVTLVLTAAASAVLGWFVAGRVLRPCAR